MRGRLAFAAIAVVAAIAVFIVGLLSGTATNTAGRHSPARRASAPVGSQSLSGNATPTPSAAIPAAASNMRLVFDATFAGPRLDRSIWDTCYPWANAAKGCTNFSNPEVEWYMPSQVQLTGGVLSLVAQRIPTVGYTKSGTSKVYECRSGMVTTHPGFNFEYGYVQIVARIPDGADLWPALWLEASNLQWPPEIDLLEHWGPPASYSGMYFHPVGAEPVIMHLPASANVTDGWHTFALDWTSSSISWYLDGNLMLSVDQNIPHQKMYLIANVAAFEKNGVSSCDGTLQLKSVKVWQQ